MNISVAVLYLKIIVQIWRSIDTFQSYTNVCQYFFMLVQ